MTAFQKFCHYAFGWDYVHFEGKIFTGPLKVQWLPNGEAFVKLEKLIHIPNKLPPEGIELDYEHVKGKIMPLTPNITWQGDAQ